MFFYTALINSLQLKINPNNTLSFENIDGLVTSKGAESFIKLGVNDFTFFLGYTYTDAEIQANGIESEFTLTPRHSIKGDVLYSLPSQWRLGVDYEYKSSQKLSNGSYTQDYITFGAMAERYLDRWMFFGNIENIFDFRQTLNGRIISAPNNTPQFTEVWAPLDGLVINFGVKLKL
jgi:iron complex outermembrane receptor protein